MGGDLVLVRAHAGQQDEVLLAALEGVHARDLHLAPGEPRAQGDREGHLG